MKRYFLPLCLGMAAWCFAESRASAQFGGGFQGGGISGGGGGGFRPSAGSTGLNRSGLRGGGFGQGGFNQQFISPLQRGTTGQFFDGGGLNNTFNNNARNNFGGRQVGSGGGFGNFNRNPVRLKAYAFQVPSLPADPSEIQPRLEEILSGDSLADSSKRKLRLSLDGTILVLSGTVPNAREKQLAESMVRLEPGVYEVRNELEVAATN